MPLTITLHTGTSIPLEVDTIRMETVREQSTDDIARTLVQRGNRQVELGEFFTISGSASDDQTMVWEGNCEKVKLIGTHLADGKVIVEGNAGMHLGAEMIGGEIVVNGNATDWVGAEMQGGSIHVHGNAGHLVGAVYRGGRRGMKGGEILIDGDVGNEVGHTMRRGLIAVGGRCGDACGVGMIAGSVFIFGETGIRYGAGMKRGSICLLGEQSAVDPLPTFQAGGIGNPLWLTFYLRHLRERGFAVPDDCGNQSYRRYCGDFLELGKGELLMRAA